jgi:hypothetical protein
METPHLYHKSLTPETPLKRRTSLVPVHPVRRNRAQPLTSMFFVLNAGPLPLTQTKQSLDKTIVPFSHDPVAGMLTHARIFSDKVKFFFRESSPQTPLPCNEVMDLQVDYWTAGGKKESSKVNTKSIMSCRTYSKCS